ncbi:MAG: cellulase family glycosylhydrolase, partial [Caldilineaceae bacterium]|nr:cellulase family glycosylhydrolase [Caldilineaceae bacterium]
LDCREVLINGDAEDISGWEIPLTERPATYTNERRFAGDRTLKLGADDTDQRFVGESLAAQTVTLPDDAEFIQLTAQIWRGQNGENVRQYLLLEGADTVDTVFDEAVDAQEWQSLSYNLTAWRGQSLRLIFGVDNAGDAGRAVLYVDDVSVRACRPLADIVGAVAASRSLLSDTTTLHLPLIGGVWATPTPTQTSPPTATSTDTPTVEDVIPCTPLLVNGGFEDDNGWTRPVTAARAQFTADLAFAGSRSLRLGLPANVANRYTDSTAYQSVQLPGSDDENEDATLTLRAQVWRNGVSGDRDFHYLWVIVGGRTYRIFQDLTNTDGWTSITYDLTPYAGQRAQIFLGTYNNGTGGNASMYVDEIEIDHCVAAPPTPTPTPLPSPTVTPTPTTQHAPPAEMSSPDFGVNAFLWWRPEIADRDLGLIEDAGFRWVRQSFAWEDIEIADDSYQWEIADRVVQHVNQGGFSLLARLGSDPDLGNFWAGSPPNNSDDFVAFVSVLAQRYNCTPAAVGCIQAYQIWNEPNLAREWGGNRPSPAQYLDILASAYAAIKAANPNALVISAGMAPTGTDNDIAMPDQRFYEEMYRLMQGDPAGYFDLLGVHAAGFAAPPELSPAQVADDPDYGGHRFFAFRHVEDIRSIMEAYGDDETRIAILEFGWTSDSYNEDYIWFGAGAGIDEFVKADYLQRAYAYAEENWQPWIALMSVLTMPNLDWIADGNPYDEEQYWWALMEPSPIDQLNFRPAYIVLCDVLNQRQDATCPHAPE